MTDEPTDEALENLFVEETGFDPDDFPAAIFGFARAVLAKWGTPATGGEPAGTVGYTVHGTQYVNWRTKPPAHGTPLYTTPQPTQTQAWAVPLTRDQVKAILVESGYYDADAQHKSHFMNGIRHGEAAHGIKHGGQHGTE